MTRPVRAQRHRFRRYPPASVEMTPRPGPPTTTPHSILTRVAFSDLLVPYDSSGAGFLQYLSPFWTIMNDKRIVGIGQRYMFFGPSLSYQGIDLWTGDYPTTTNYGQVVNTGEIGQIGAHSYIGLVEHHRVQYLASDGENKIWLLVQYDVNPAVGSPDYQQDLFEVNISARSLTRIGIASAQYSSLEVPFTVPGSEISVEDFWPLTSPFYNPADGGLYAYGSSGAAGRLSPQPTAALVKFVGTRELPPGSSEWSTSLQAHFEPVMEFGVPGNPGTGDAVAFAPNGNLYAFGRSIDMGNGSRNLRKFVSATNHTLLWDATFITASGSLIFTDQGGNVLQMLVGGGGQGTGANGRNTADGSGRFYYSTIKYYDGVLDTEADIQSFGYLIPGARPFISGSLIGYLNGSGYGHTHLVDGAIWTQETIAVGEDRHHAFYRFDPILVGTPLITPRPTAQASEISTRYHRIY